MKKTLLGTLLSSFMLLGGCASQNATDQAFSFYNTEKERIKYNQSFSKMHEITVQFVDLQDTSDVRELFLSEDMNAVYLNDSDYLKRIKTIDVSKNTQTSLFIKDSDINEEPKLHKSTTVRSYIEEVEVKTIEGVLEKTDFTIGTIEYGFEMKTSIKKNEKTGKDIVELHIKNSSLNKMNRIPVNDEYYIETPELSIDDIKSTLSFDRSGHFIKKIEDNKIVIVSLKKSIDTNQENNQETK